MEVQSSDQLTGKQCEPCQGVEPYSLPQAQQQVAQLNDWKLTHDGKRIRRDWVVKNFLTAIDFFGKVSVLAESEAHHPDLHVENYKDVWIEIWTHDIGGLCENDFIMAAKIDEIPVELG